MRPPRQEEGSVVEAPARAPSASRSQAATEEPASNRWLLLLALLLGLALAAALAWRGTDLLIDRSLSALSGASERGAWADGLRQWWLDRNLALLEPVSDDAAVVAFEVRPGELLPELSARLAEEGLIRDAAAFRTLARLRGLDTRIQAGAHELRRDMDAETLLQALLVAPGEEQILTIPEGWRLEEVADLLASSGLADRDAFITLALAPDRARWPVLATLPEGASLEGYLFPDTYAFEPGAGAQTVIDRLLETLEARLTPELRASAAASDLSLHELITLASIVEREAVLAEESPRIARVYLNRLAEPPYILNADPTVQYALGYQPEQQSWWKRPLLYVDLEVDSPYNSYRLPGLPPGPIASPGMTSILAVLEPEPGPWHYFVADERACDGSHVFARTLEEHSANIANYQGGDCSP